MLKSLFVFVFCWSSLAAESIDPDQLDHAMQVGIAEMATVERVRLSEVGITDLSTFVATQCHFLDNEHYLCLAVAKGRLQSDTDHHMYNVLVIVPIVGVIQNNQVTKFVVESVQIKVIDSSAFQTGPLTLFGTRIRTKAHVAPAVIRATKMLKSKSWIMLKS